MGKRVDALWRLLFIVPLVLITYLTAFLAYLFFIPWFLLDIVWQLLTGREGLAPGGLATRIHAWTAANTRVVLFGQGSWQWTP